MNRHTKKSTWVILWIITVVIVLLFFSPNIVEQYYTNGLYPLIAKLQRFVLGWIPFSVGDVFYGLVIFILLKKLIQLFKKGKRGFTQKGLFYCCKKILFITLWIFVLFYGFWGLNYSRVGIAGQLGLNDDKFSVNDLDTLVLLLHTKLNTKAEQLKPGMRDEYRSHKALFKGAKAAYDIVGKKYHFLEYKPVSLKPSMFSYLGNYLGFQGYYNPFSGEAQVNTTIPVCVEPFVTTHEIAHQLGYAKESEANFVGYLACKENPSVVYTYSVYFDMYHYAIRELYYQDSINAAAYDSTLHTQVKKDIEAYRDFYKRYKNPIEPVISQLYGYFLKANRQPKGREAYNDVVTWLIAFYKKYGKENI